MARIEVLPLFIFLGILGLATSLEDLRTQKIRNAWIIATVAFTFWFYLLMFILFRDRYDDLATQIAGDVLVNGAISLAVGFAFWKLGLWPPGDGKLFFAYALLLPLGYYSHGYLPYFPSLALLINAFAVALFYLLGRTILAELTGSNLRRHVANVKSLGAPQGRTLLIGALWDRREPLLKAFLTGALVLLVMTGVKEVWVSGQQGSRVVLYYLLFMLAYGTFRRELEGVMSTLQVELLIIFCLLGFTILLGPARLPAYLFSVAHLAVPLLVFGVGLGSLVRLFVASLDDGAIPFAPFLFAGALLTLLLKQSVVRFALSLAR